MVVVLEWGTKIPQFRLCLLVLDVTYYLKGWVVLNGHLGRIAAVATSPNFMNCSVFLATWNRTLCEKSVYQQKDNLHILPFWNKCDCRKCISCLFEGGPKNLLPPKLNHWIMVNWSLIKIMKTDLATDSQSMATPMSKVLTVVRHHIVCCERLEQNNFSWICFHDD